MKLLGKLGPNVVFRPATPEQDTGLVTTAGNSILAPASSWQTRKQRGINTSSKPQIWPLFQNWSRGVQTIFPSLEVPALAHTMHQGQIKDQRREWLWTDTTELLKGISPFPQAGTSVQSCWSSHPLRLLTTDIKMYRRSQIAFLTALWFKISRHFQQVPTSDGKKEQTERSSLSFVLRCILYQSIKEINIPIINLAYSPYRGDGWLPCENVEIKALCSPRDFGSIRQNTAQTTLM